MLAIFLVCLIGGSLWLFTQRWWWLPELGSVHGAAIDRVFLITLAISGVLFVLLQGILAFLTYRYGKNGSGRARYWVRPWLEKQFALFAGIIIFGVDVTLFAIGTATVLVFWTSGSLYRDRSRDGYCRRSARNIHSEAGLRLQSDGELLDGDRGAQPHRLGTPHVCQRYERAARRSLCLNDATDHDPFGYSRSLLDRRFMGSSNSV
jgi:hypothetical protein